jgi:hypothetical protein
MLLLVYKRVIGAQASKEDVGISGTTRRTHTLSGRGAGGYSEREDDGPVFVAPREGFITDARPSRVQIAARERAVAVETLHITPYVDQRCCARLLKEPLFIR